MELVALALFGSVVAWGASRYLLQSAFLSYRASKYREQAEASARQAHEIQAATVARVGALETNLGAALDRLAALDKLNIEARLRDVDNAKALRTMSRTG